MVVSMPVPSQASRTCSFTRSSPPASSNAWRLASGGGMPWRTFRSVISSRYARNSASRVISRRSRPTRLARSRFIFADSRILYLLPSLSSFEDLVHRLNDARPIFLLHRQLTAAAASQRIRADTAALGGLHPVSLYPTFLFHAVQGRK